MAGASVGLRARKKLATATALQHAALDLFREQGYVQTSVQQIADAAGVSQRTFFRYFSTKDAVLLSDHGRREAALRELLATRPPEPVGDLLRVVVVHLADGVNDRRDLLAAQNGVFLTVPALADRFCGHHDRLALIVAEHVARVLGVSAGTDPRPRLAGGQVIRAWTTSTLLWFLDGMEGDVRHRATETLRLARRDEALVDVA